MQAHASLIRELEESIRGGSPDHRVLTLRRVTDLFVHRAEQYDEEQVKLFDGVIGQLASEIEKSALSELASRLAPIANAPIGVIHSLARNDEISISGAVLTQSLRLGENDLIEIARTKSQAHLLAICGRERLPPAVTDVLVERGGQEVAHKVVANDGAAFSEIGFANLVARAGGDESLAEGIGRRIDIPPHLFRTLIAQATERVQKRLLAAASPEMQVAIRHVLSEISDKVEANSELASRSYSAARSFVQVLAQSEKLGTKALVNFAKGDVSRRRLQPLPNLQRCRSKSSTEQCMANPSIRCWYYAARKASTGPPCARFFSFAGIAARLRPSSLSRHAMTTTCFPLRPPSAFCVSGRCGRQIDKRR